jgi:predicted metal-dependent peptidase
MNIVQAKMHAIARNPYLRDAIVAMKAVESREIDTAAVDKHWRMYWNPDFFAKLNLEEAAGIVLHELDHLIDNDMKRAASLGVTPKNPRLRLYAKLWNMAADAVINERRRREGVQLPDGGIYPETLGLDRNVTKEQAFRTLLDRNDEPQEDSQQGPGAANDNQKGGQSGDGGEGQAGNSPGDQDGDQDGSQSSSQGGSQSGSQGSGGNEPSNDRSNGSGADGIERSWELDPPEEQPYGPGKQPTSGGDGLTETEADTVRRKAAESIKSRGAGAGSWSELADSVLNVDADPRKIFRKAFRRAVRLSASGGTSTYRRPPRQPVMGLITPGKMGAEPNISVIVDTSGSMSHRDIGMAMGFINKMLKKLGLTELDVAMGDAELKDRRKVRRKLNNLQIVGRGGTHMGKLVELAAKNKPHPEAIVVITDGWTPWCEDVGIPTFAIITQLSGYETPEWITSVRLSEVA